MEESMPIYGPSSLKTLRRAQTKVRMPLRRRNKFSVFYFWVFFDFLRLDNLGFLIIRLLNFFFFWEGEEGTRPNRIQEFSGEHILRDFDKKDQERKNLFELLLFLNFVWVYFLIKVRNSSLVLLSSLKTPSMVLVTVLLWGFWTPLITMHRCLKRFWFWFIFFLYSININQEKQREIITMIPQQLLLLGVWEPQR